MTRKIDSILIVGGGSSGWMTAAAIARQLPDVKLSLIESANIPTIGVGESTIGHINNYFHLLKIEDEEWMPHCNATYKTSIKFIDFRENPTEKPHMFHYPFGQFDFQDKPRQLMDWFLIKAHNPDIDCSNFAEFFHDSVMMTDANKLTKNADGFVRNFRFKTDTAYHMDAAAFGVYLKDYICLPAGMTHIVDDVVGHSINKDGEIAYILTKNSGNLEADLYIDCTGFKSLLLEKAMGVPFTSFKDTLFNDRAIAAPLPYIDKPKEMENYTSCTAIEAGWVWNVPLWNRIGTGYVYSSDFATEAEAEEQFRRHLKSNRMIFPDAARADAAEIRHIKIRHGAHSRTWEKNVVAVGLSNGFIEPLESTGLMLTHEALVKIINMLKMRDRRITQYDIDLFNHAFNEEIKGFKDFISQHYSCSMRDDTPYWKAVTSHHYSKNMNDMIPELYTSYLDMALRLHRSRNFDPAMAGIAYIAAGMGYNPIDESYAALLDEQFGEPKGYREVIHKQWLEHKEKLMKHIETLPTHYQFLKDNIHKDQQ